MQIAYYNSDMSQVMTDYIEIRQNRRGLDRAYIRGTRVRVQDVYVDAEVSGKTPDEIVAAFPHLSLAQVHAALAYYFDHRDAILNEIREDEDFVAQMKARTGPGPLESKLSKCEPASGDPVSSR
jgi:uncharacterized protein (DUF433 family)